jgi:hypothetical protein
MKSEGFLAGSFSPGQPCRSRERPLTGFPIPACESRLWEKDWQGPGGRRFSEGEEVMLFAVVFLGVMSLTLSLAAIVLAMAR